MTGCGCLLLVAVLGALLYVLVFGSTDTGEPVEQAVALALVLAGVRQAAIAGRRAAPVAARS